MSFPKFYEQQMRSPLPLALFLIVLIGCGQAERERREAARKTPA